MFPITGAGKFVAAITMVCGLLVIAFPITIIGANLAEVYDEERRKRELRILREENLRLSMLAKKEQKIPDSMDQILLELNQESRKVGQELEIFANKFETVKKYQEKIDNLVTKLQQFD